MFVYHKVLWAYIWPSIWPWRIYLCWFVRSLGTVQSDEL